MHNQLSWRFTRAITVLATISCQWSSETAGPVYKSMAWKEQEFALHSTIWERPPGRDGRPTELTWFEIAWARQNLRQGRLLKSMATRCSLRART